LTTKTPIVFRRLRDRHLKVGGSQVQLSLRSLEQQANEVFLRLDRATFEHTDFDDRVTWRSPGRIVEIFGFERKEAVRSLASRKRKRIHHARVTYLRESSLDQIEVFFDAVYLDLCRRSTLSLTGSSRGEANRDRSDPQLRQPGPRLEGRTSALGSGTLPLQQLHPANHRLENADERCLQPLPRYPRFLSRTEETVYRRPSPAHRDTQSARVEQRFLQCPYLG
jgi:hypothetical protein